MQLLVSNTPRSLKKLEPRCKMVVSGFCVCPYQSAELDGETFFESNPQSTTLLPLPNDLLTRIQQHGIVITSDNARSPPAECILSMKQFSPVSRQASFRSIYHTNREKHVERALVVRRHVSRWESDSRLDRLRTMPSHTRIGGDNLAIMGRNKLMTVRRINAIEPVIQEEGAGINEGLRERSLQSSLDVSSHRVFPSLQSMNERFIGAESNSIDQGPPKMPVRAKADVQRSSSDPETMSLYSLLDMPTSMREKPQVGSPRKRPPKLPVRKAFIDHVLTEAIAISTNLDINS